MKPLLRKCLTAGAIGIIELLLLFPVLFIIYMQSPNSGALWQWLVLLWAGYPVGFLINRLFKFRHSFLLQVIALILSGWFSCLLRGLSVEALLTAIGLTFCLFRGEQMAVASLSYRLQPRHYTFGLLAYFFVSLFFSLRPDYGSAYRQDYTAAGLIVLVLTLFQLNRGTVNQESLSGNHEPAVEPAVRRHNRYYVAVILVITVILVFTSQIQAVLGSLFKTFRTWLAQLLEGGDKVTPPPQTPQNEMKPDLPLPAETAKTMSHWVDYLLYGLFGLIIAALLWFALRKLRFLPGWLRLLREKFAALFQRDKMIAAKGYIDEVRSIRKSDRLGGFWRSSSKEPRKRWKDLQDNESRIRYLYQQWVGRSIRNGYAFKPHLTPTETFADLRLQLQKRDNIAGDELVQSYNRVRYGGKAVSDEQLRLLLEQYEKNGREGHIKHK